ncbi:penicillin-binding protein, transpeptidase domain protein [Tissierellia bacterium KA00581]|jgi:hypothetical protein|nr:penicillin-binding protein, transpeptidase domain protein [Tissierellia bacterium KA00581]
MIENKRYIRVLTLISILFLIILGYMTYFQVVKADKLKNDENNKRNWVDDNKLKRGNILDRDGNILAQTIDGENKEKIRNFPYGKTYAHLVGYNSKKYGKTGLEKRFNSVLINKHDKTPIAELKKIVIDQKEGNTIKLTTNTQLQEFALSLLNGKKGSVILMNPKTGEVLAMADSPTFDPNNIEKEWNNIINDEKNATLLQRSTSGLFAPGSVYKLVTGTAILENLKGTFLKYNDKGATTIENYTIRNLLNKRYGNIDLKKAIEVSANTYFADKVGEVGVDKMIDVNKRFMFGEDIDTDFKLTKSPLAFNKNTTALELATGAFGQGKVLVTPMQVALFTSAIANDGNMMKPFVVKEILDPNGKVIKETKPEILSKVSDVETMKTMKEYLKNSGDVNFRGFVNGQKVGGKTGTAEVTKDILNAWSTVFYPADDPRLVCTIVYEGVDFMGVKTIPMSKQLVNKAIELGY